MPSEWWNSIQEKYSDNHILVYSHYRSHERNMAEVSKQSDSFFKSLTLVELWWLQRLIVVDPDYRFYSLTMQQSQSTNSIILIYNTFWKSNSVLFQDRPSDYSSPQTSSINDKSFLLLITFKSKHWKVILFYILLIIAITSWKFASYHISISLYH